MATLSEYLEGCMRVPLSLLTSEGFAECPVVFSDRASVTEFQQFLDNRNQPITGIVTPRRLDHILEDLEVTRTQFRQTLHLQSPWVNRQHKIDCLLGQHCLDKARYSLGNNYECIVRIYSIPPEPPSKYSHGEICRQALLHDKEPDRLRQWLGKLPAGKQKHLMMVFRRPAIWKAMKDMAPLPGLWEDMKLGNWAKHLAAHMDKQIERFWKHMREVWTKIFDGLDQCLQAHLDVHSAGFLQFKAPAWSKVDRQAIRAEMRKGALFQNISDQAQRDRLLENLLRIQGVIPSILTFHENMRYLTIGAKILEHHVEVKRRKRPRERPPEIWKPAESLVANLKPDWTSIGNHVEVEEGHYQAVHDKIEPESAFVQLLLMALRLFPFLGPDPPLQDLKGCGMAAFIDDSYRRRLCIGAYCLGYRNRNIQAGIELSASELPRKIPDNFQVADQTSSWRGGLPTINVYQMLKGHSFLPTLDRALREHTGLEPNPLLIKLDFLYAFFGQFSLNIDQSKTAVDYSVLAQQSTPLQTDNEVDMVSRQRQQRPKDLPPGQAPKSKEAKRLKQGETAKRAAAPSTRSREKAQADIRRLVPDSRTESGRDKRKGVRFEARHLAHEDRLASEVDAQREADTQMLAIPEPGPAVPDVQHSMPGPDVPESALSVPDLPDQQMDDAIQRAPNPDQGRKHRNRNARYGPYGHRPERTGSPGPRRAEDNRRRSLSPPGSRQGVTQASESRLRRDRRTPSPSVPDTTQIMPRRDQRIPSPSAPDTTQIMPQRDRMPSPSVPDTTQTMPRRDQQTPSLLVPDTTQARPPVGIGDPSLVQAVASKAGPQPGLESSSASGRHKNPSGNQRDARVAQPDGAIERPKLGEAQEVGHAQTRAESHDFFLEDDDTEPSVPNAQAFRVIAPDLDEEEL